MAIAFASGTRTNGVLRAARAGIAAAALALCGLANIAAQAAEPAPVAAPKVASGTLVYVSGTLSVQRPDGAILSLGQKSEVFPGDLLSTQMDSYAQINFTDGSSMTMRPNTQMKVEAYNYVQDKPQEDSGFFRLVKGGMRIVSGLVGKRGNHDAYQIRTATATIGIRGSVGDLAQCAPSCEGVFKGREILEPGTYLETHNDAFTMRTGDKMVVIEQGYTGYSNGVDIKVTLGGLGGGKIDLYLPTASGLKATDCK